MTEDQIIRANGKVYFTPTQYNIMKTEMEEQNGSS